MSNKLSARDLKVRSFQTLPQGQLAAVLGQDAELPAEEMDSENWDQTEECGCCKTTNPSTEL